MRCWRLAALLTATTPDQSHPADAVEFVPALVDALVGFATDTIERLPSAYSDDAGATPATLDLVPKTPFFFVWRLAAIFHVSCLQLRSQALRVLDNVATVEQCCSVSRIASPASRRSPHGSAAELKHLRSQFRPSLFPSLGPDEATTREPSAAPSMLARVLADGAATSQSAAVVVPAATLWNRHGLAYFGARAMRRHRTAPRLLQSCEVWLRLAIDAVVERAGVEQNDALRRTTDFVRRVVTRLRRGNYTHIGDTTPTSLPGSPLVVRGLLEALFDLFAAEFSLMSNAEAKGQFVCCQCADTPSNRLHHCA